MKHGGSIGNNSPLLIVDTGKVTMDNGMVWGESECPEVGGHSTVKDPSLLENITKIDVGIQKCRVKLYSLFNRK